MYQQSQASKVFIKEKEYTPKITSVGRPGKRASAPKNKEAKDLYLNEDTKCFRGGVTGGLRAGLC